MKHNEIPPEFHHLSHLQDIPWSSIIEGATKKKETGKTHFSAITDFIIEMATDESMKKEANQSLLRIGIEAALVRGRLAEALFLSTESESIEILSLRAIALFVLSDIKALGEVVSKLDKLVCNDSDSTDRVRLSTSRIFQAAVERDTSVITCVMEFDNLLESNPEQVEEPIIETMFTLYVVGSLLLEIGQPQRAVHIADTLLDMARKRNHRMIIALVENLRGNIANLLGNFEDAEEHYYRLQKISQDLDFRLGLGMALNNLGVLRLNSIKIEEALTLFHEAYEYLDMNRGKLVSLVNIGEIETVLGMYDDAFEHLLEAIRLERKTQSDIIEVYTWTSILFSRKGEFEKALANLKIAKEITERSEKPKQIGAYLHAKGIFHALNGETDNAIDAFTKGIEIARDNDIFEILIKIKLEFARFNLEEYMKTKEDAFLSESAYHLDDLIQIAKEQGLQSLYAESLLLRSDIFRIGGKELEAKGDLERILSIASFHDDSRIEKQAQKRLALLHKSEKSKTLGQSEMEKSLDRVSGFKPAGQLRSIPFPTLYTIIALNRRSGLTEYVHSFEDSPRVDSSIISGFISAIASFTNEFMGERGLLRSINHEGFVLMMEYTKTRIVTLVASEETFDTRYRLHEFAKVFDSDYPPDDLDGIETSRYSGANELVERIFNIKLDEPDE